MTEVRQYAGRFGEPLVHSPWSIVQCPMSLDSCIKHARMTILTHAGLFGNTPEEVLVDSQQ